MKRLSNVELIDQLKSYYHKYGKVPRASQSTKDGISGSKTFIQHFGSWNNALIQAGFEPNFVIVGETECKCHQCGKTFYKLNHKLKHPRNKSKRFFCSISCAATYNNAHKTVGYRRSKLENYIEVNLKQDYPNLNILFNDNSAICAELDIYIPSLRLAFELNGIFHYEPIYSQIKFEKMQFNDKQKIIRCYEAGIELCVIDTSKFKYFKPKVADMYYQIVKQHIDRCINR